MLLYKKERWRTNAHAFYFPNSNRCKDNTIQLNLQGFLRKLSSLCQILQQPGGHAPWFPASGICAAYPLRHDP